MAIQSVGQLGFADYYDGDLPGAQKKVAEALIGVHRNHGYRGASLFLSTTAQGMVLQGVNDQALIYADRAIALANATPDAGCPVIAEEARLLAIVKMGRIAAAQDELKKVLGRPDVQDSRGQRAEFERTAARLAQMQGDIPAAIT